MTEAEIELAHQIKNTSAKLKIVSMSLLGIIVATFVFSHGPIVKLVAIASWIIVDVMRGVYEDRVNKYLIIVAERIIRDLSKHKIQ